MTRGPIDLRRRQVLLSTGALVGCLATTGAASSRQRTSRGAEQAVDGRGIALHNLHTDERLDVVYWRDGGYVPQALEAIEHVLRDFRNGERHAIDPKLMDYLFDVAASTGAEPRFGVISGYRSPETNERLRERGTGVAQRSMHLQGRAIDVRLQGVDSLNLATHAEALTRGGVGYYRKSDFVHLDTGAFRTWRG